MTSTSPSRLVAGSVALLFLFQAGCGGPKQVTVRGTLIQGGQPIKVSEKTYVTVTFAPVEQGEGQGQTYTAAFKHEDASFERTLPSGTYYIRVVIAPPGPPGGQAPIRPLVDPTKTYEIQEDKKIDLEISK
jgi:hypothetical protein